MNAEFDLLYLENGREVSDQALSDLGFDVIGNDAFSENPLLYKNFCKVLRFPIYNRGTLLERQKIYLDFCKYPYLIEDIDEYCNYAKGFYLDPFGKTFRTVNDRLRYYLSNTLELIGVYDNFHEIFKNLNFVSCTLGKYKHVFCTPLKKELEKLTVLYKSSSFTLKVDFSNGFKLKSASLNDIDNTKIQFLYTDKKKKREFLPLTEDYFFFGGNDFVYNVINELQNSMILNLCQNISSINYAIKDFFLKIAEEIKFYKAALVLKKYMEDKNLSFCMPEIVECEIGIRAEGIYDMGLASSTAGKITSNDLNMERGKILLVTGHNRGGKTTFLKSIGIAQIMAQAGLFVPAKKYCCQVYQGILTHFPSEEDHTLNDGKLVEELKRLKKDFHILKGGGLALFNESFSTTTTKEGSKIGIDVLRAVRESGSHAIFVTHLMELMEIRNLIEDVLSLTTENAHSYKIIEGDPLPDIRAYEMLRL